jgi:hypothetical protein
MPLMTLTPMRRNRVVPKISEKMGEIGGCLTKLPGVW